MRSALAALVALTALLPGMDAMGESAAPRLLVMDLPYARVWAGAVQALGGYPLARASDGVIETQRVERAPRPDDLGVARVAEQVTVHVEAVAPLVTRVTVQVRLEGLRAGRWEPLEDDGATVRAVLDRIRAAQS